MVAAVTRWDAVGHPIGHPIHMAQPYYHARGTNSRFHDDDTQQAGLTLDRGLNAFATPCAAEATAEPLPACSPGDSPPSTDHNADAAPLECMHRRGMGPVDMTNSRVSLARSSMRPSLDRSCASRSSTSASRSSVSSRNASENRAAGASRQATDIRGQADRMPAPS